MSCSQGGSTNSEDSVHSATCLAHMRRLRAETLIEWLLSVTVTFTLFCQDWCEDTSDVSPPALGGLFYFPLLVIGKVKESCDTAISGWPLTLAFRSGCAPVFSTGASCVS